MDPTALPPADVPHLVQLAAVTWDFPLAGRTRRITEALRADGRRVTWVPCPYLRTGLQRLARLGRAVEEPSIVRPWPAAPLRWWSALGEPRLRRITARRARALRRDLEARLDPATAVALVVTPAWAPWLDELGFGTVVYDCIDHVRVHTPRPELGPAFRRWEDELLARADGVVASATSLRDDLLARRPGVPAAVVRNGVDTALFGAALDGGSTRPPRPAGLPSGDRPLVGFVGALYEWVDTGLIGDVARAMPETDFVFVGPADGRAELPALPNVHALGFRPHADVPRHLAAFDVCWLPFRRDVVSTSANPVKIYEYLAAGRPVVSTPVADPGHFEGHVAFAEDAAGVVAALHDALRDARDRDAAAARARFAAAHDWRDRAHELARFVDALAARRADAARVAVTR